MTYTCWCRLILAVVSEAEVGYPANMASQKRKAPVGNAVYFFGVQIYGENHGLKLANRSGILPRDANEVANPR